MNKIQEKRDLDTRISNILEKLIITKLSFKKMNTYARIVSELAGEHIECGGLMVGEHRNGIPIVTDAVLLDGTVTPASGHFDYDRMNEEYLHARDEGKVIMGMWHSHGDFGVFHSKHDDAHLDVLLDRNARLLPNLLLCEKRESNVDRSLIEMKETSITIKEPSRQRAIIIKFHDGDHDAVQRTIASIEGVYVEETRGIPFAASVVINRESYDNPGHIENPVPGETVYIEAVAKHPSLNKRTLKSRGIGIEILHDDSTLDEELMCEEVGKKVIYDGKKLESKLEAAHLKTEEESKLENNIATQDADKKQNGAREEIIEWGEIAKRYDQIVHSDTYVKAIESKILHRYRMRKIKHLLGKIGPECATRIYHLYMKQQGRDDGQDQKTA